ncbi:carboxypeptidase-like regulatory domain-containing protein [bacterium]|nr:carboxypeptidase-like regulatory domain-containing protein [bacterium]
MILKRVFLFLSFLLIAPTLFGSGAVVEEKRKKEAESDTIKISGFVLEKGTRKPLQKQLFFIKESGREVRTGKDGSFAFSLPPGKWTFSFPIMGYTPYETAIIVKKGEKLTLTFRLIPLVYNPYRIVVQAKRKKGAVSVQRLTIEEAMAIPGTNRDVFAAVANLPGVNSISVFNGYGTGLIIRGSAPEDSIRMVGDQSIPMLYHFGGLESVIEPELVSGIDFFAGGYPSQYFNALGGVIQVDLRNPRNDRWGGYGNFSLLSTSFMVEGPIGKKDSLAISFKRGMIDLYLAIANETGAMGNAFAFTTYPTYYDMTTIYRHEFSRRNDLRIITIGSWDEVKANFDNNSYNQQVGSSALSRTAFMQVIGEWRYRKKGFKSILSPSIQVVGTKNNIGSDLYINSTDFRGVISYKFSKKLGKHHEIKAGVRALWGGYKLNISAFAIPKEGDVTFNPLDSEMVDHSKGFYWYPGMFIQDRMTYGGFTVLPGLSFMIDPHNKKISLDPRITLRYDFNKKWALKSAGGIYSKVAANDESYEPWGTVGLEPEHALHIIGGVEYHPIEQIEIDIQGWYKNFYNMIVRNDSDNASSYNNSGKGYAYGFEVLLRHKESDHFFGWISYSFGISRRLDALGINGADPEWRPFDSDINHNLTVVASYKFNAYWQLGARFRLIGRDPFTDLTNSDYIYDADNGFSTPLPNSPINNSELPFYHQLDIRLDKFWLFNKWVLSTYIDIQNVYYHKNPIAVGYSADYSKKVYTYSLPLMVFIGIKGDW